MRKNPRRIVEKLEKVANFYKGKAEHYSKESSIIDLRYKLFFQYQKWLTSNYPKPDDLEEQINSVRKLKYKPLISILVPVYKTPISLLRECFNSVIEQTYDNWELCVVDDCSNDKELSRVLEEYANKYPTKFKYKARSKNGHISKSSNDALGLARGEFIALLDHDDVMWPNALYEIVYALNKDRETDLIYTDEDKLDDAVVHAHPYQKPSYDEYFLMGCNYITHFAAIRTTLVRDIGGFRDGVEGAQDWDLFLRITQKTTNIKHIPKIVYSWRVIESSTAQGGFSAKPYAYDAQKKAALDNSISRKISVIDTKLPTGYVGWMMLFNLPSNIDLAVVLDECYEVGSIETAIARINDSLIPGVDVRFYIRNTKFKQQFINRNKQLHKTLNPVFFDDYTQVNIEEGYIMYLRGVVDIHGEESWLNTYLGYLMVEGVDAVTAPVRSKQHTVLSAGVVLGTDNEPVMLLNDYIQGIDQRFDTSLMAQRSVEAADGRFFITSKEVFREFTKGNRKEYLLTDGTVLYIPFLSVFVNSDPTALHEYKNVNQFSYSLPEGNPFWAIDTIYRTTPTQ